MILNPPQARAVVAAREAIDQIGTDCKLTLRFPFETYVSELDFAIQVKKFIGPYRYRSERYATWAHFKEAYDLPT